MRLVIKLLLAATIVLAGVVSSLAESHQLQSKPTEFELAGACQSAGGSYWNDSAAEGLPHTYGCRVQNCDGEGGECSVTCGTSACTGTTPAALKAGTLLMILQNGNPVDHFYEQPEQPATPDHPGPAAPPARSEPPSNSGPILR